MPFNNKVSWCSLVHQQCCLCLEEDSSSGTRGGTVVPEMHGWEALITTADKLSPAEASSAPLALCIVLRAGWMKALIKQWQDLGLLRKWKLEEIISKPPYSKSSHVNQYWSVINRSPSDLMRKESKIWHMNLSTKQTHRHREQTCGCQGAVGWKDGLGVWD